MCSVRYFGNVVNDIKTSNQTQCPTKVCHKVPNSIPNFIKINHLEYLKSENFISLQKDHLSKFIITLGSKGFQYDEKIYPVNNEVDVRDLSGAGDTFLASFVSEYLKNHDTLESLMFAQNMASSVVEKSGVNVAGEKKPKVKLIEFKKLS